MNKISLEDKYRLLTFMSKDIECKLQTGSLQFMMLETNAKSEWKKVSPEWATDLSGHLPSFAPLILNFHSLSFNGTEITRSNCF